MHTTLRRDNQPAINIGERLARARAEKGVSLADASAATKLKTAYIEALENNHFEQLPAPVYAKNFIRIYARYLGLDAALLADEYGKRAPHIASPPARHEVVPTYHVSLFITRIFQHKFLFAAVVIGVILLIFYMCAPASSGHSTGAAAKPGPGRTPAADKQAADAVDAYAPVFDKKENLPRIE